MKSHPFDPLSLAFGLLFAVGGLLFAFAGVTVTDLDNDLLWSAVILGTGLLFLIPAISRARGEARVDGPESPEEEDENR